MRGPLGLLAIALRACGGAQQVEPANPDVAASEPVTAPTAPVLATHGSADARSLPKHVAGIPLGERFDPARQCGEHAVDPSGSGFVGCAWPPVILTDMNPTIAVNVLGGTIVGAMLFFDRSPLAMLTTKYGEPEYWRTDGKARTATSLIPRVGLAVWRLSDGDVSMRHAAKYYEVMYDARDVRKAIESANY